MHVRGARVARYVVAGHAPGKEIFALDIMMIYIIIHYG